MRMRWSAGPHGDGRTASDATGAATHACASKAAVLLLPIADKDEDGW